MPGPAPSGTESNNNPASTPYPTSVAGPSTRVPGNSATASETSSVVSEGPSSLVVCYKGNCVTLPVTSQGASMSTPVAVSHASSSSAPIGPEPSPASATPAISTYAGLAAAVKISGLAAVVVPLLHVLF